MIIASKKYACETCIKGHRSSACKHTDRPLFEIKKKGRPVTQCEHCRELRKTKQVHVKCICEPKSDYQQGPKPGFESAAFPTGLPPALGASVAFPNSVDGASSDSDPGGVLNGHRCKSGDPCNCVKPRSRAHASGGGGSAGGDNPSNAVASSSRRAGGPTSPPAPNILERIYALRPIVPRPSSQGPGAYPSGGHNPSTGMPHPPPSRQHGGFAPYDPRYGMTTHSSVPPQSYGALPAPSTFSFEEQAFNDPFRMGTWPQDDAMDGASLGLPSMCGCGDDCSCPGCIHHSRAAPMPSSSAYSSCNNPGHCGTCLDCTIMTLPPNAILPPNTALSIYDSSEAIDDWLRTMSASIPTDQTAFQQNFFSFQQQQQQQASWNSNANNVLPSGFGGYNPNQSMMPFNDRSGVPPHTRHRSIPSDDINIDPRLLPPLNSSSSSSRKGSRGAADGMLRPFLTIPDSDHSTMHPRSRSPSTSSQSSQGHHGHASDGGGGIAPPYRPSGRVQGMYDPRHPAPATTSSSSSRSAPPLNMNVRPSMARGPSSASSSASGVSPSPGSASASAGSHSGHGQGRNSAHAQAAGRVPSYGSGGSPPGSAHAESASSSSGRGGEGGAGGPSLAGLHIY